MINTTFHLHLQCVICCFNPLTYSFPLWGSKMAFCHPVWHVRIYILYQDAQDLYRSHILFRVSSLFPSLQKEMKRCLGLYLRFICRLWNLTDLHLRFEIKFCGFFNNAWLQSTSLAGAPAGLCTLRGFKNSSFKGWVQPKMKNSVIFKQLKQTGDSWNKRHRYRHSPEIGSYFLKRYLNHFFKMKSAL